MKIGLVLATPPAYSETFFRNKIRFLQENIGWEVILLADNKAKGRMFSFCKTYYGSTLLRNSWLKKVQIIFTLFKCILICPVRSLALWNLNKSDGFSLKQNVLSLLHSAHILPHSYDWLHFGFGTLVLGRENLAKAIDAKMAVSFRGYDYYVYPVKFPQCYQYLFRKSIRIHVLSESMKYGLIKQGLISKNIYKITPAIDIENFSYQYKVEMRAPYHILTVARFHWIKGLEYTLDALKILKEIGIPFRYLIIGEGMELEKLLFIRNQLSLDAEVQIVGKLSSDQIKEKMLESDIYVQYSIEEGFCNAVLEAQAMGSLCIVSNAEGLSENVINEKTGWVVPKRNPELLARKIESIVKMDRNKLEDIRYTAIQRVKNEFNLEKQKEAFFNFYNET